MRPQRDKTNFNPFPGLRPFAPEECDLFFGRDRESEDILGKLHKNRIVTVIGASGSGKSSLINCGVIPKLRNLKNNEFSDLKIISFRPGVDPFGNLADAISENISSSGKGKADRDNILSELKNNKEGIGSAVKKLVIKDREKVLLIIDQFEELFRYNKLIQADSDVLPTVHFVDFIINSVSKTDNSVYAIVAIGSGYIGECSSYHGLVQAINNSSYLLPFMGAENCRQAIEGPVKYAGANIDSNLVDLLLRDIDRRTDQLPVLQHALSRTWAHWQQLELPDLPISKNDYDSIGTISDAISLHADESFEELDAREKIICERIFKAITARGQDNKGIRQPLSVRSIKYITGCTSEEVNEVVEKFRISSRSFITPLHNVALTDDLIVDLSHECVMSLWERLSAWIDEEAGSVEMYLRLSEASSMYQQGKAGLLKAPDLQLAINWREKHKPTITWAERFDPAFERAMVYLRTSEKRFIEEEENRIRLQKRKMKRTRIIASIFGVAMIISLTFMIFSYKAKINADRQIILAEKLRVEAVKGKTMADSSASAALEQRTIAEANAAAASLMANEAKAQIDRANRMRSMAERKANEAMLRQDITMLQYDSAKISGLRANEEARIAIEQKNASQRLRMLSLGKLMSLKSLQLQDHKDLQTIIAYQAYLFNKQNNGFENDADIYAGLYNVALQCGGIYNKTFKGHTGAINSIAFAPGKNEFFTSGNDGQVLKWSLDSKEQVLQVIHSGSDIIEVLAVSPDASWLACGSQNSSIRMIPLKGDNMEYVMNGHSGKIKSLIFSYDGMNLYSAALDGKVLKWDITARTNKVVSDGTMQITSIDISSNGKYLAGIKSDGSVEVWNPDNNAESFSIETAGKNINVIRFNPENNLLALGDINGNVELWDINLREKISEVKAHNKQVNDIQFNPTLKQMATASNDKTLKIFDLKDPADLTEPPVTFADNDGFVLEIQFSPDGQMIVLGTFEGSPNLVSRAAHAEYLARDVSNVLTRDMTQNEWDTYVGKDIPYENTYQERSYKIKVDQIR